MRRDWLLYLVIFSLALNLGTIGTLVYLRWWAPPPPPPPPREAPLPFRQLLEELNLEPDQRQKLRGLFPGHLRQVRELEQQLRAQRRELLNLLQQEELPEWPAIQVKVREIGKVQLQLEEEKLSHLLEIQKNLTPEQRRRLVTHLERRLPPLWERRGHGWGLRHLPRESCPPSLPPESSPAR